MCSARRPSRLEAVEARAHATPGCPSHALTHVGRGHKLGMQMHSRTCVWGLAAHARARCVPVCDCACSPAQARSVRATATAPARNVVWHCGPLTGHLCTHPAWALGRWRHGEAISHAQVVRSARSCKIRCRVQPVSLTPTDPLAGATSLPCRNQFAVRPALCNRSLGRRRQRIAARPSGAPHHP